MSSYENDRAFESVLHTTGNIDKFIDEFFSFLARRTDFFVVTTNEESKFGFPPGIAAKLIISKFKKWESFKSQTSQNPAKPTELASSSKSKESKAEPEPSGKSRKPEDVNPKNVDKEKKGDFNSYNGRKTDKYSWSQSIKDLDVAVVVGEDVKSKRDVQVDITARNIRIVVPSEAEPVLVDWTLPDPIVKDESYWSLHPSESIFLSLQKAREKWWDHLFEGEELIDRTQIDAVRPLEELGDEEQAKIQEIVWNQEQKLKGLPTTEELRVQEIMKEAWNAEGSPFKGQPYDPNLVKPANSMFQVQDPPTNEN